MAEESFGRPIFDAFEEGRPWREALRVAAYRAARYLRDAVDRGVSEGVMGSIYRILVNRMQRGEGTARAADFVPELMYIAVRPYPGQEAAREELSMPPPDDTYGYRGRRG